MSPIKGVYDREPVPKQHSRILQGRGYMTVSQSPNSKAAFSEDGAATLKFLGLGTPLSPTPPQASLVLVLFPMPPKPGGSQVVLVTSPPAAAASSPPWPPACSTPPAAARSRAWAPDLLPRPPLNRQRWPSTNLRQPPLQPASSPLGSSLFPDRSSLWSAVSSSMVGRRAEASRPGSARSREAWRRRS